MNKVYKDNKGFTLVELIIVIAIIAILSVVLAPNYLRYVERAHQTNDITKASIIRDAAIAACTDPQNGVDPDAKVEVVWSTTSLAVDAGINHIHVSVNPADSEAAQKVAALVAEALGVELDSADHSQTVPVPAESKMAAGEGFTVGIQNGVAAIDDAKSPQWKAAMGG